VACETIRTFFNVFYVFSKSKKHDFLRFFELLHTFSRTLCVTMLIDRAVFKGGGVTGSTPSPKFWQI